MSFDTEKLIRKFSEEPKSVHYRKPADNGQVTELQPDFKKEDEFSFKKSLDRVEQNGILLGRTELRMNVILAIQSNPEITVMEILQGLVADKF